MNEKKLQTLEMPDSITTCKCGETYVVGNPENEVWHNQVHDEYLNGLNVTEVQSLQSIAWREQLRIAVINNSVEEPIRKAIARVAMVAHRCMPSYKACYYGTNSEENLSLYALVDNTRIIGMVIMSYEEHLCWYTWNAKGDLQPCITDFTSHGGPKITRVWIAASYRSRGLAQWLVREVAADLSCLVSDMGWEMPFTESGEKLAKSLCPKEF